MEKNMTLVEVVKRTYWGDWAKFRLETSGKIVTVFVPRGK